MGFLCHWAHVPGCCGRGWAGARWADRRSCEPALHFPLLQTKVKTDMEVYCFWKINGKIFPGIYLVHKFDVNFIWLYIAIKKSRWRCRQYLYWMWGRRAQPAGILEAAEWGQTGREPWKCCPQRLGLLLHTQTTHLLFTLPFQYSIFPFLSKSVNLKKSN